MKKKFLEIELEIFDIGEDLLMFSTGEENKDAEGVYDGTWVWG